MTWTTIPGVDRLGKVGLAVGSAVLALLTMMVGATGALLSAFFAQILAADRKALVATHARGNDDPASSEDHRLRLCRVCLAAWLPLIAAMVVSGYLGTVYGSRLLETMPEPTFRFWFRIGLTILALDMVRRGLADYLRDRLP